MTRKILHRALRTSRGLVLAIGAVVISAVVLGAATAALAAVPGDPFRLGQVNVINKFTKLVGAGNAPRLVIDNNGSGVALRLLVEPGKPPMQVNSGAKVARFNADRLDDLDQSAFLRKNGKAADADRLDGKDSTAYLPSAVYQKTSSPNFVPANSTRTYKVLCDSGDSVLSGGYTGFIDADSSIESSFPHLSSDGSEQGWTVKISTGATTDTLYMVALCARTTP